MNENRELNLQTIFEQELQAPESFVPEELPSEWTVGQHRYFRVADGEDALSKQLEEFRASGVRVLDFDRRWGFLIFKTAAPKE